LLRMEKEKFKNPFLREKKDGRKGERTKINTSTRRREKENERIRKETSRKNFRKIEELGSGAVASSDQRKQDWAKNQAR